MVDFTMNLMSELTMNIKGMSIILLEKLKLKTCMHPNK